MMLSKLRCHLRSFAVSTLANNAFTIPPSGHVTSYIVESLDGTCKHLRQLSPLRLLISIWSSVMEIFVKDKRKLQDDNGKY